MKLAVPLVILASMLICGAAAAQGLKGAPTGCLRSASQPPPLIEGKSDKERWSKILAIQPSLIGMKYEQVTRTLGYGKTDKKASYLAYRIIERDGQHKPGDLAGIDLSISFEKGVVESYRVDAVHWAN